MEFNNLVHFIEAYTHDSGQAEDLAQESLCALWEKRDSIDPRRNLRSYLYRIARNRTINSLKEKSLFADISRRDCLTEDITALEDASIDEMIDSLELSRLIKSVYANLPSVAKDSFIMSRQRGMTNKEIASERGLSVKAVEYHIRISLRTFRKMLKEYMEIL